jgi:predicted permease
MPDRIDWLGIVRAHLPVVTGDAARDEDIAEELAQHLALRFDEARRAGAGEEAARAAALDELQNSAAIRSAIADAERKRPAAPLPPAGRTRPFLDLWGDFRYAVRRARRSPGFAAAALATIALGVGLTTAVFSVVNGVLLRPLPFSEANGLMMVWQTDRSAGTIREPASVPDLFDFAERSRQIERFGAFGSYEATLQHGDGEPTRVSALAVTSDLPALFGVEPVAGRAFRPGDYLPRGPRVVLISERLWTRLFNRDRAALGDSLRIDDLPATIAGVVPDEADFGVLQSLSSAAYARGFADRDARTRVDLWSPIQATAATAPRGQHGLMILGRLAPAATPASAQGEMTRIAAALEQEHPENDARGVFVEPLERVVLGRVRTPLTILLAAAVLVLVIAGVNVANLLLARGTTRWREIAVRTALGADMPRLVRQLLAENVLLAALGAVLGFALAYVALKAIAALAPGDIPRIADVDLDSRVLLLAALAASGVGVAFGFLPLVRVRTGAPGAMLRQTGAGAAAGGRARSLLVTGEVAMAVVLLTSAGLLIRSLWLMNQVDPGFEVRSVLKAEFQLPAVRYPLAFGRPALPDSAFVRFRDDLLARVAQIPGVQAVALAGNHPLDSGFTTSFAVVGREAEARSWPELPVRAITPDYFPVLGIPLLGGRPLTAADGVSSATDRARARPVVVNQALADRFFANSNPLGQRLRFFGPVEWVIVGVVGNERFHGVRSPAPFAAYVLQDYVPAPMLALLVRSQGDPAALARPVRAAIRELDPALAVFAMEPLGDTLSNSFSQPRFLATLLGLFAALAVTLATIGVYGVLSYAVARKTRDIGVRIAFGADTRQVLRLVAREGTALIGAGIAVGVALALLSSRWLSSLLFEVTPADPVSLGGSVILVLTVAALATLIPARRAIRIDPLAALRQE